MLDEPIDNYNIQSLHAPTKIYDSTEDSHFTMF